MRIAIFHNRYKRPGGEDVAVDFEHRLLESAGHKVLRVEVNNDQITNGGTLATLRGAVMTTARSRWNRHSLVVIEKQLRDFGADVGHVHNWFPIFSPSIYDAHRRAGVPVVQTLHNYRLGCANGCFWRDGGICTDCLDNHRARAVSRGCYRKSRMQSLVWRSVINHGWDSGAFRKSVSAYIAPSKIIRDVHTRMGLPSNRIHLVPHAVEDPGTTGWHMGVPSAIFVGRLEPEKGIDVLIDACVRSNVPLTVVGDGSLGESLRRRYAGNHSIRFLGHLSHHRVMAYMRLASVAVFPSRWMEPFGLGVAEAMALGRPVIASNFAGPSEIVEDGVSGIHVSPGSTDALGTALKKLLGNPIRCQEMGRAARMNYLKNYSPAKHLVRLMSVFDGLVQKKAAYAS